MEAAGAVSLRGSRHRMLVTDPESRCSHIGNKDWRARDRVYLQRRRLPGDRLEAAREPPKRLVETFGASPPCSAGPALHQARGAHTTPTPASAGVGRSFRWRAGLSEMERARVARSDAGFGGVDVELLELLFAEHLDDERSLVPFERVLRLGR